MKEALKEAKRARKYGEVPIGSVVVFEDRIIGRGYNRRNTDHSTLAHAELTAIRKASRAMGDWRLEGCTIYITLEPCPMCAGAIVQARLDRCVIGAMSPKSGCAGSLYNLLAEKKFNHQVDTEYGVMAEESEALLKLFFQELRVENKRLKEEERNA
ncbi:MAG: tRNA adenosine(34) deaminase TadA [Lachnospiraceae bacterium]|nr:tRNA adenosine(34) deaminase TadA [Lachnospiraceae bacterium]